MVAENEEYFFPLLFCRLGKLRTFGGCYLHFVHKEMASCCKLYYSNINLKIGKHMHVGKQRLKSRRHRRRMTTSAKQLLCIFTAMMLVFLVVVSGAEDVRRTDFPDTFIFGAGSSAYQVEGAAFEDGRMPSIWDTFAHSGIYGGANADVSCDAYHKYKDDVKLMADTGLEGYRFSISWSRLIPNGRGPINPKGLQYYNNLIDELIGHGIQPHVTLCHSDLPQALEDEYGGWMSRKIIDDFTAYADVCFKEFGDRVLYWTTLNEVNVFTIGGYDIGLSPPNHCSPPSGVRPCSMGNSSTEPYIVAHNILLAHSAAVRLYRRKYKSTQHGFVGLNLFAYRPLPYTNKTADIIAVQRVYDFYIGWFANPLMFGDYPDIMKRNVGSRLPKFTGEESMQVKDAVDFIALNHYQTVHVKDSPSSLETKIMDFDNDGAFQVIYTDDDSPPGQTEYPVTHPGLGGVLEYLKQAYGNPPIYIHENGQLTPRNAMLNDTSRVQYLQAYIGNLLDAMRNGSNVKGYFMWSFLDCFELLDAYGSAFGLYYVDLNDKDLTRYPKLSAYWYSNFLKGKASKHAATLEIEDKVLHSSQ
ncbi:beta-glucosidase 11-like isoform X4 [Lycium barbarum]|uniref:beta-glucosidase 11-like isoform X4 n=1 Tax=Lycium barbarum TaxID=112863 RepID=UPI00293F65E9|nr:beta-glucosidase 11-like isoform X4 [Lycium barbarum]